VYGLGLIAKTDSQDSQPYYLTDGLASTTGLTDRQGNLVGAYAYDVFGAIPSETGGQANDYRFTGQQLSGAHGCLGPSWARPLARHLRRDVLRRDLEDYAPLARLPERIPVPSQVLLGQPVDVLVGSLAGDLHHPSPHRGVGVLTPLPDHIDGNARVAPDVPGLLPALRRVHQNVSSVKIDPHRGHLRRPVRHQRCKVTEIGLLEELPDAFQHFTRHRSSPFKARHSHAPAQRKRSLSAGRMSSWAEPSARW